MLAKIAHTFAVYSVPADGLLTFELLLTDLIRHGSDRFPAALVGGGISDLVTGKRYLHEMYIWSGLSRDWEYLVATINLFTPLTTPHYQVVVGRRPRRQGPLLGDYVLLPDL